MKHLVVAAFLCSALSSQVQVAVVGTSPHVATTTVGGVTDTRPGGFAPSVVQSAQSLGAESTTARITSAVTQNAISCSASIEHRLDVIEAPASNVAATATSDVVLEFSAATAEAVFLQANPTLGVTAGVAAPAVSIDVGDDGSIEWTPSPSMPSFTMQTVLGAVPVRVRVRMDASLDLTGTLQASLTVAALPDHATQIDVVLFGCSVPCHLYAFRTFGGGVELGTFGLPPTGPVLLVFGLGLAPFVLPSAAPSPCLVLPSIDIVTLIPSPLGYSLPLPPSVRPVTFWAQAIPITVAGFEATGAYRIQAN